MPGHGSLPTSSFPAPPPILALGTKALGISAHDQTLSPKPQPLQVYGTDYVGPWLLTHLLLPHLKKAPDGPTPYTTVILELACAAQLASAAEVREMSEMA